MEHAEETLAGQRDLWWWAWTLAEWSPRTPGPCPPSLSFCPNTSFRAVSPGDPVTNLNALLPPSVPALLSSLAPATLFLRLLSVPPLLTVCKDRHLRAIPPGLERCWWWVGEARQIFIGWVYAWLFLLTALQRNHWHSMQLRHSVCPIPWLPAYSWRLGKVHGSLSWGVFLWMTRERKRTFLLLA